jgi:hypothetical protein
VWFWHPLLMSSRQRFCEPNRVSLIRQSVGDGDKKEFVAGKSTKETVKTIARGKPGDFRRNRGDYRVLPTNAHGLRVLRAPGFPCSLRFSRDMFLKSSGKIMPRECEVTSAAALPTVVARQRGAH